MPHWGWSQCENAYGQSTLSPSAPSSWQRLMGILYKVLLLYILYIASPISWFCTAVVWWLLVNSRITAHRHYWFDVGATPQKKGYDSDQMLYCMSGMSITILTASFKSVTTAIRIVFHNPLHRVPAMLPKTTGTSRRGQETGVLA